MKVILYVFSGTGNTLKVAALYKKFFNADVDIYRISEKSGNAPSPDGYDLVGIGYPIHAFVAPEPVIKFVKNLKSVAYRRAFIFKTSGEGLHLNDSSSYKILKILRKKGYDVTMEKHIVMPYNMIYRHSDAMAKQMWIYAKALVKLSVDNLSACKREKIKLRRIRNFFIPPIGWIEQKFTHAHGPMFKIDAKKCVNCGKCAAVCPENNITIKDGKYKFGTKCVLCMGCSFGCPEDAVHVGLFKFWKVNGSYRLDELAADESVYFPLVPDCAKGIYRKKKKYYREADKMLENAGIDVQSYI